MSSNIFALIVGMIAGAALTVGGLSIWAWRSMRAAGSIKSREPVRENIVIKRG